MPLNQPTAKARIFVGIGEVLFDLFENGVETLGGAPLNVALHAHQLAAPLGVGHGIVVSCVGDDARGERIRAALRQRGMSTEFIATDRRPTGRVLVFMRNGEPAYQIEADAAWDYLEPGASLDDLAAVCDAVSFGSLAQRSSVSRSTIRRFLGKATNAVRLYDANLRGNMTSSDRGYSAETIDASCRLASIIKANVSELRTMCALLGIGTENGTVSARRGMESLLARYPAEAVVLTNGPKGTTVLTRDKEITAATPSVSETELHPVGAGDASSAGILFARSMGCDYLSAVELANRLGTWVASQQSATPRLPDSILEYARETMSVRPQV